MIERLKPYREYKESGQAWLGQVPKHWAILPNRAIPRDLVKASHRRLLTALKPKPTPATTTV